jgi:hypothetical protein
MSTEDKIIVTGCAGLVGQPADAATLARVNAGVEVIEANLFQSLAGRLRHAQPVRPRGFGAEIRMAIAGLQIADTCSYYSDDRSIPERVRVGRLPACAIDPPR